MKFVELKNQLSSGIKPAYLITGNDRFLCYSALSEIKKKLALSMPDLNEVIIDGGTATAEQIVESASVFPFMDSYRIVQVNGFNIKNKGKDDKLLTYLKSPMKETVLIFFNLEGSEALKPYLDLIEVIDCDKLSKDVIVSTLAAKLSKSSVPFDREALDTLALYAGCDMARVSSELEKLISYAGASKITTDMVKSLVVEDKEYQIYQLADFIANRNGLKALDLVQVLTNDKRGGFSILTPLYNNYRRVLYCAINKDKTEKELASLLSVKEYAIKMAMSQSRAFTPKKLKAIVDMLYNFDRDIKQGRIKEEVAIKLAVINILKIRG